jgi:hypothetical protein
MERSSQHGFKLEAGGHHIIVFDVGTGHHPMNEPHLQKWTA